MVKTDRELQNEFLQSRDEEERKLTVDFACRLLQIELEIKALKEDMKVIKEDAKEKGVLVKNVNKVIAQMKRAMKEKTSENVDNDRIYAILEQSEEFQDLLFRLNAN
jgi:uncharacterized protein (UPF0335 family)